MAIDRAIQVIHGPLDKIAALDDLNVNVAVDGTTGWNELEQDLKGMADIGQATFRIMGRNLSGAKIPVLGYAGDAFTETASLILEFPLELKGGWTNFEINFKVHLQGAGTANVGRFKIDIGISGVFTNAFDQDANAIGTPDYSNTINGTLTPTNGETNGGVIRLTYIKSTPAIQSGMGVTHWEGLLFLQFHQYRQ